VIQVSSTLKELYVARGLETEVLEQYQNVVDELEEKIVDDQAVYGTQSMLKTGLLQLSDSPRD